LNLQTRIRTQFFKLPYFYVLLLLCSSTLMFPSLMFPYFMFLYFDVPIFDVPLLYVLLHWCSRYLKQVFFRYLNCIYCSFNYFRGWPFDINACQEFVWSFWKKRFPGFHWNEHIVVYLCRDLEASFESALFSDVHQMWKECELAYVTFMTSVTVYDVAPLSKRICKKSIYCRNIFNNNWYNDLIFKFS